MVLGKLDKRMKLKHFLMLYTKINPMELEHSLMLYKKINPKWIKYLNVRPDAIKLLEGKIGRTLFGINCSNVFWIHLLKQ